MNEENYQRLKTILIIIAVAALGVLLINQSLGYYYKSRFLQSPCTLCEELNPNYLLNNCNKIDRVIPGFNEAYNITPINITIEGGIE
jgi:hypothetical protein